jgi:hypothetical protein
MTVRMIMMVSNAIDTTNRRYAFSLGADDVHPVKGGDADMVEIVRIEYMAMEI